MIENGNDPKTGKGIEQSMRALDVVDEGLLFGTIKEGNLKNSFAFKVMERVKKGFKTKADLEEFQEGVF
jgi:hypothetical protein